MLISFQRASTKLDHSDKDDTKQTKLKQRERRAALTDSTREIERETNHTHMYNNDAGSSRNSVGYSLIIIIK